jgi:uncharacterized membrane protein YesL
MGRFFDLDSPLMRGLSRMADLIWVNLLTLLFFVPAIMMSSVTAATMIETKALPFWGLALTWALLLLGGPALTAMHYVLLKMTRDEESYITRSFFKSFRLNFVQSVGLSAIVNTVAMILIADAYLLGMETLAQFPVVLRALMIAVSVYLFLVSLWIFPMQCHFVNTVGGTLKNSFFFAVLSLPRSIGMALLTALPVVLFYFFDLHVLPVLLMFGFSGPGYFCACLYNKAFKRFEPEVTPVADEDFHVLTAEEEAEREAEIPEAEAAGGLPDKGDEDAAE